MSRRFHLHIAEGVQFSTGECVLNWLTKHKSLAFYQSIETLVEIHGHGGKTLVVWDDVEIIAGHRCAPHLGHSLEFKCQHCDAVFVEPDGVWFMASDPKCISVPTPRCPARVATPARAQSVAERMDRAEPAAARRAAERLAE